jgi:transcriptional regulator with XRE-family HTH domain
MLSYYLKVPIERFWKGTVLSQEDPEFDTLDIEHTQVIRHRRIGNILEEARLSLEITYEDITEKTGISYGRMKRFETGNSPVPLPELELLSNLLNIKLSNYYDSETDAGKWIKAQAGIAEFLALPEELQEFVSKPINRPYLEIANKLSTLSADQLRSIAESLLDITI